MKITVSRVQGLKGEIEIPGDKSISHRAIILTSLAEGRSRITGLLESKDVKKTIDAFKAMGVPIEKSANGEYKVEGVGLVGLKEPVSFIDCGNSGTTMRLLTGLLAAQDFYSVLVGDRSLISRPMERIIEPLQKMGARIWSREGGYAPLSLLGTELNGIKYKLPVASAQVKSAILLAGLYSNQDTLIIEPTKTRDHTERMFKKTGIKIRVFENEIILSGSNRKISAGRFQIPGDISSAAFFIAAAVITSNSDIIIKNVGINPTRSGFLKVLNKMGARIEVINFRNLDQEPVADLRIKSSKLSGTIIEGDIIPLLIDEIPILTVLASQAEGETIIKDAIELRVKESDRISSLVSQLGKLGVDIRERPDGMIIKGPTSIQGGINLKSYGDHRIAMALSIIGLITESGLTIDGVQSIGTSFPGFKEIITSLL